MREISVHPDIRRAITMMGGIEVVVVVAAVVAVVKLIFKKVSFSRSSSFLT